MALVPKTKKTSVDSLKSEAVKLALDKLLDVVKTYPLKIVTQGSTGGDNARYGAVVLNPGNKLELKYNGYPCHRYMKDYKNPIVVFNQYGHRNNINPDADKAYFNWITGEKSPWKSFVGRNVSHTSSSVERTETDLDFIFNNGWVWSDLQNHPANLQHSFLIASRMPAEWAPLINKWYEWVQKGAHPGLAMVFLDVFRPISDDTKNFLVNHNNKYDWPLDVCTSGEEYVQNFCSGKTVNLLKPYSETQIYTPVNTVFGNGVSSADDKAYPNVVFTHYSNAKDKEKCKEYWDRRGGTGFSEFNYRNNWFVSEEEVIDIMAREGKRLSI